MTLPQLVLLVLLVLLLVALAVGVCVWPPVAARGPRGQRGSGGLLGVEGAANEHPTSDKAAAAHP